MIKVVVGSPVKQKPAILEQFLQSLENLDYEGLTVEYVFVDDDEGCNLLYAFAGKYANTTIFKGDNPLEYHCDEETHCWQENLIWKVAAYKDRIIEYALQARADYLFLADSDLYLHPQTVKHLLSLKKDIVSEVYWTKWALQFAPLPQVWVGDQYRLFHAERGVEYSSDEQAMKSQEFIDMLKNPGVYKVGGLGACTLISRYALERGANFKEIYNLGFIGEDRHFCVRAVALGLELYADTWYPPFHIYRESELVNLAKYKHRIARNTEHPKLTVGMLVKNESGRYLERVLQHIAQYADEVVILDDGSTDNTVAICREKLVNIVHCIVENSISGFSNEVELRKTLWELAGGTNPDWIMILDADEIFEHKAAEGIRELIKDDSVDVVYFRLYDMWNESSYREDSYWIAHRVYRPFLVRYRSGYKYEWQEQPLHCGRFPINIFDRTGKQSQLRLQHFGWARPEDRVAKYFRYKELDPKAKYGVQEQYLSILDPKPNLIKWRDDE
ncbi:glycosyltransferase [Sporomusa malonica]|uniref:glycosyltransferase n=1 Tax=Sporomusa malonica TaxID=112901 RepID=UPI001FE33600|nr:glycosyltransferase family 2 protein [Sporomusa malonica]